MGRASSNAAGVEAYQMLLLLLRVPEILKRKQESSQKKVLTPN
jgi:hypothetical protein